MKHAEPALLGLARTAWRCSVVLAALFAASNPAIAEDGATTPGAPPAIARDIGDQARGDLRAFYRSRANRPLWLTAAGTISPAALALLDLVRTAEIDGLDPAELEVGALERAMRKVKGGPGERSLARAELALSKTFAAYVEAIRQTRDGGLTYASPLLAPVAPTTQAALAAAAKARSLDEYVSEMGWMHPLYAPLRKAAADETEPARRALLKTNLARLRAIPAHPARRYVLVNAATARLYMYEDDRVVDSMKVVVGKVDNQTPMLAGFIRRAILNPYWNIPPDLTRNTVAPRVLERGPGYIKAARYQVMSTWDDKAEVVDPATIDWQAVADGSRELRVRQLPGGDNFMGRVKFEFPNALGIYLHDTPEKKLMSETSRQFSSGCVRLEDAQRFGKWLMGKPLPRQVKQVEQRVDLPELVPVYITYLTAEPQGDGIAFHSDPYNRDRPVLAGGDDVRRSR
jgi:murein L,D-transpeptidase YcbB/YkuD